MLIVPVLTSSDKKRIPFLCIALIIINSLIFFALLPEDTRHNEEAFAYYQESGLLALELEVYRDWLNRQGKPGGDADLDDEQQRHRLLRRMFGDERFQELIDSGQAIDAADSRYPDWRSKRAAFNEMRSRTSSNRFGYSPKWNNISGMFTCMFMHGGFMHLLGNMVFLYLVGSILEAAVGPAFFLGLYLLAGICSSALFGLVYPATPGPLVGASGAISGLMGAYGVVFGLRRIRVFYSLGFYFNYALLPALALFPVWLVNEFFQLYTSENSNVAYVAHIGGLLTGVAIGAGYRRLLRGRIDALFAKAEQKQSIEDYLERGLKRLVEFDLSGARADFVKVLAVDPANLQATRQLYVIDKASPDSDRFHDSAHRLLGRLKNSAPDDYLALYEDYRAIARQPRLTVDVLETMSFLYLKKRDFRKAAPLVAALLKQRPDSANLPGYLLNLGDGFRQLNRFDEARRCYAVLAKRYPLAAESAAAQKRLAGLPS